MHKLLLNIPEDLLEETDMKARRVHIRRSEAVRQALRSWVSEDAGLSPKDRPGFQTRLTRIESVRCQASARVKPVDAARWVRADRDSR
jgi:metal-responsive CopG/Arc/MetJ family transcriptional regulator